MRHRLRRAPSIRLLDLIRLDKLALAVGEPVAGDRGEQGPGFALLEDRRLVAPGDRERPAHRGGGVAGEDLADEQRAIPYDQPSLTIPSQPQGFMH
jgi:hypothetical protein